MKKLLLSFLILSQVSLAHAELIRLPAKAELKQVLLSLGMVRLLASSEQIMFFFPSGQIITPEMLREKVRAAVMVNSIHLGGHPFSPQNQFTFVNSVTDKTEKIFNALYEMYKV